MPTTAQPIVYPKAKTVDVVERYHGTRISDPYRWMEDENAPDLKTWIDAQNALTNAYLGTVAGRNKIQTRLTELWNYPRYSVPYHRGKQFFFSKNDGLQNQSVLYTQTALTGEPRILLDPNTLSSDGTIALSSTSMSKDGSLMAYGLSASGSDWQDVHVRSVVTGMDYRDTLKWCKFASVAWKHDNSGFFYNRFPDPNTVPKGQESYNNKVYWHTLGSPQSADALVYERPDAPDLSFSPFITDDGSYLALVVWRGTDPVNRFYYRSLNATGDFIRLMDKADAKYDFIANDGSVFYFQTNLDAPKDRIIAVDTRDADPTKWKTVIPEQKDPIAFASVINNQFVVAYLQDAHHVLRIYALNGTFQKEIPLPTLGSISGLSGEREDTEMFFGFTSYLFPTTIYRYDFAAATLSVLREPGIRFDASLYETKQVFYPSADGTTIPMFLTYKKGLALDGQNPTLLYGYGGFNVSLTPGFSASRIVWLEMGGIYAVANLRGGNEYGEEWHRAGMLEKKQNVFDDFIAAAEWLIANNYTSSPKIAINGGSNGGLLTAACMLQRPNLFGAVVCEVPVIDMLRYHLFTVGRYWIGEYGNAIANADDFKYMMAYSPLHNIRKGVAYPPTLITTADHDDRVVPAHAMKFAATLQANDAGTNPILVRIETKAGHGGGKPTAKQIEELTDVYSFLVRTVGMRP
ncbi:MAG: prolyl oligopeptidase family serine peptidase [Bacteroidetes bacterium]|nr:prolyl oligopeptidase family serine peptidase [Bacteroidota bacterium]